MRISDWSSDVCSSDLKFAEAGLLKIVIGLVPDQEMAAIFGAEFAAQAVAMLPGAFDEIAGYAQVKRAVAAAGHDVDVTGLAHRLSLPCSCEGRKPALPSTCNRTV